MKKPANLRDAIDQMDDKYLVEALEYQPKSEGRQRAGKGLRERNAMPFSKIVLAACLMLAFIGTVLFYGIRRNAGEVNQGKESGVTEEIYYVKSFDPHTYLAGPEETITVKTTSPSGSDAEGDEESDPGKNESQPFVTLKWVYPQWGNNVSRKTETEINRKLKEDGYNFGVKFVALPSMSTNSLVEHEKYQELLYESGADIAFTGFESLGDHYGETAVKEGKFVPLNSYLEKSSLWDEIPQVLWDAVSYQGFVYFIPNEAMLNGGQKIFFRKDSFSEEEAEQFSGDLLSLERFFEEGKTLLWQGGDFYFAETFGYSCYGGLLFSEDGKAVNPLEEERCVEWLRMINQWFLKGQVRKEFHHEIDMVLGLGSETIRNWWPTGYREEDTYSYEWKGYATPRWIDQTGILASSANRDQAFRLLEVFHTDPSYANLLIHGKEYLDGTGESKGYWINRLIFGLDVGVHRTGMSEGISWPKGYSSQEERKQYFEEHILPSPALYLDLPEECDEIQAIEAKYAGLAFSWKFEEKLEKYRKELKGPMEAALKKINQE